jgi:hypothetical protein
MPEQALQKLQRLMRLQNKMKPKTIYEEMAREGLLHEYITNFMNEKISKDDEFRDEMFDLIYEHSKEVIPGMDTYILEMLCECLGYFEEYTKECLNPVQ